VNDFSKQYEDVFRQLGVEIGRALAARIVAARAASGTADEAALVPARILPGLTGRRRRAGEAPPRCGRAGCNKASRTRGYCQTHYVQWLKAGEHRRAG